MEISHKCLESLSQSRDRGIRSTVQRVCGVSENLWRLCLAMSKIFARGEKPTLLLIIDWPRGCFVMIQCKVPVEMSDNGTERARPKLQ